MRIERPRKLRSARSHIGLEGMIISVFLGINDTMERYDRANIAGPQVTPEIYIFGDLVMRTI